MGSTAQLGGRAAHKGAKTMRESVPPVSSPCNAPWQCRQHPSRFMTACMQCAMQGQAHLQAGLNAGERHLLGLDDGERVQQRRDALQSSSGWPPASAMPLVEITSCWGCVVEEPWAASNGVDDTACVCGLCVLLVSLIRKVQRQPAARALPKTCRRPGTETSACRACPSPPPPAAASLALLPSWSLTPTTSALTVAATGTTSRFAWVWPVLRWLRLGAFEAFHYSSADNNIEVEYVSRGWVCGAHHVLHTPATVKGAADRHEAQWVQMGGLGW